MQVHPETGGAGVQDGQSPRVGADPRAVVHQVTKQVLHEAEADGGQSFVGQGGDSLSAVAFAASVGDQLGIEVPLDLVLESEKLDDLADYLSGQLADTPDATAG